MKLFALCLLFSLPLVFTACAPSQMTTAPPAAVTPPVQTAPPPTPVVEAPAPVVAATPAVVVVEPLPATVVPEPHTTAIAATTASSDSIREKHLAKAQEPKTLLQVIREAGVPDDNLTPGRKEQIAVYQHEGKYQFYHFRDARLIATGEYPRSLIEQMQQQGTYPREVVRDFNRLLQ